MEAILYGHHYSPAVSSERTRLEPPTPVPVRKAPQQHSALLQQQPGGNNPPQTHAAAAPSAAQKPRTKARSAMPSASNNPPDPSRHHRRNGSPSPTRKHRKSLPLHAPTAGASQFTIHGGGEPSSARRHPPAHPHGDRPSSPAAEPATSPTTAYTALPNRNLSALAATALALANANPAAADVGDDGDDAPDDVEQPRKEDKRKRHEAHERERAAMYGPRTDEPEDDEGQRKKKRSKKDRNTVGATSLAAAAADAAEEPVTPTPKRKKSRHAPAPETPYTGPSRSAADVSMSALLASGRKKREHAGGDGDERAAKKHAQHQRRESRTGADMAVSSLLVTPRPVRPAADTAQPESSKSARKRDKKKDKSRSKDRTVENTMGVSSLLATPGAAAYASVPVTPARRDNLDVSDSDSEAENSDERRARRRAEKAERKAAKAEKKAKKAEKKARKAEKSDKAEKRAKKDKGKQRAVVSEGSPVEEPIEEPVEEPVDDEVDELDETPPPSSPPRAPVPASVPAPARAAPATATGPSRLLPVGDDDSDSASSDSDSDASAGNASRGGIRRTPASLPEVEFDFSAILRGRTRRSGDAPSSPVVPPSITFPPPPPSRTRKAASRAATPAAAAAEPVPKAAAPKAKAAAAKAAAVATVATQSEPAPATALKAPAKAAPKTAARGKKKDSTEAVAAAAPAEAAVSTTSRASKTRAAAEGQTQAEQDEVLRRELANESVMNEFLASKWIEIKELQRLEAAGVLTYKRGRFSEEERSKLREWLETFRAVNRLEEKDLLDIIMAKGKAGERSMYPKFYSDLAAQVPGRPVRYVKEAVKRMYDPRARKGTWTKDEDKSLLRAYQLHPNEWTKIAALVDRSESDCRDRWRGELKGQESRVSGTWSKEETESLVAAVAEANRRLGLPPTAPETPWQVVVDLMGGTRSLTQCRKKWQDTILPELKAKEAREAGTITKISVSRRELLDRLRELNVTHERDLSWTRVVSPGWDVKPGTLRGVWHRMKHGVPGWNEMPFTDLLDRIEESL